MGNLVRRNVRILLKRVAIPPPVPKKSLICDGFGSVRLWAPVWGLVLVNIDIGFSLLAKADGFGAEGPAVLVVLGSPTVGAAAAAVMAANTSGGIPSGSERMSFWNDDGSVFHSLERCVDEASRNYQQWVHVNAGVWIIIEPLPR